MLCCACGYGNMDGCFVYEQNREESNETTFTQKFNKNHYFMSNNDKK